MSIRNKPPVRRAVLYIRGVPTDVKSTFKAWCASRGLNMTEQIIKLMRSTIQTKN